jgi:hypothetical protein
MRFPPVLFIPLLVTIIVAHPGHRIDKELQKRAEFLARHTNNLDHCASIHKAAGLDKRAIDRRASRVDDLLKIRGLQSTQVIVKPKFFPIDRFIDRQSSPLDKSHKSNKPYTPKTSPSEVFSGNRSCVLSPETTEGPFCKQSCRVYEK